MISPHIDLRDKDRAIVEEILQTHLPPHAKVGVFGSRAKGTARRGSDLDLMVDAGQRLPHPSLLKLSIAFEESALPIRVDVVDWNAIADGFRMAVEGDVVWG